MRSARRRLSEIGGALGPASNPGALAFGGGGNSGGFGLGTGIGMLIGRGSRVILGNSILSAGPPGLGLGGSVMSGHGSEHGSRGGSCDGMRTCGTAGAGSGTGRIRG